MSRKKTAEENGAGQPESPGFEKALERLETIVREMESGSLSLEKMMAHFEEGQKLVRLCSEKLNQVERKVEILLKEGDKVVAKPMESQGDDGDGAGDDEPDEADDAPESGKLPF